MLNKAYNTLKSPLPRAQYLIAQHLKCVDEENEKLEEPSFILEVMEAREEIENAASRSQLESILQVNASKLKMLYHSYFPSSKLLQERIDGILHEIEENIGSQRWQAAKDATVRLKYLEGIRDAAYGRMD
jgi:molecular chaperone HscB